MSDLTTPSAEIALLGLSWLTTYLLHSTLLLGAVWIATRALRLSDAVQESLWKTALLGGLLTTTWQVATDASPVGGTVELTSPTAPSPTPLEPPPLTPTTLDAPPGETLWAAANASDVSLRPEEGTDAGVLVADLDATDAPAAADIDLPALGLLAYGLAVALGILHLALARRRFCREIGDRELIVDGDLPTQLLRLIRRAGFPRAVRLTQSDRITTPIAFGSAQPEICIPERALRELRPDEQESMLAHELAHLLHRDPAWLLVCQTLQRVLFVQPLHLLAQRQLLRLAEYRCDAWAARNAENGLSLARCLVEVARWITPGRATITAHAAGMAANRSLLWQRVGRILETEDRPARSVPAAPLTAAVLIVAAATLPGASWVRASLEEVNVIAPTGIAAAPLPAIVELPAADGLVALQDELSLLEGELASLRLALREIEPDPETAALVAKLERYVAELRTRRDDMQSMLPATLDALRAGDAPEPARSTSTTDEGRQQ